MRNKLYFIFFSIFFRVVLEISYVKIISEVFSYSGYHLNFDSYQYTVSWIIYIYMIQLSPDRLTKVSDYFFTTALLSVVAPLTIYYGLNHEKSITPVITVLASIYLISLIIKIKVISFKNIRVIKNGTALAITVSTIFVTFLVLLYLVSNVTLNFDLTKVYDFRGINAEQTSYGVLSYTNGWTYQIFNMFLLSMSLKYKRYIFMLIIIAIQIYFFSASTHKIVLFLPLLIIGIWFYFKKTDSLIILPISFSIIIIITLGTYFIFGDIWGSTMFSRRVFFVPAHLTFTYFDFFSVNQHIYWSNSILKLFIDYPYNLSLTHIIGGHLGSEDMGANNGYVASGFAHAGYIGVLIYSIIIGFVLKLLNDITKNHLSLWLAVSLCIIPLRSLLISSDLFTVMLTHGFLVAIALMFLVRIKNE